VIKRTLYNTPGSEISVKNTTFGRLISLNNSDKEYGSTKDVGDIVFFAIVKIVDNR